MSKEKDAKAIESLGSPHKIINQLVKGAKEKAWVLDHITKSGPPHKQLQHTLVLNRLSVLAALLKKRNGLSLKNIEGKEITSEEQEQLPVSIPTQSLQKIADIDKVFDKLIKGPQHEVLYTALLLQIIEGMINAENSDVK